MVNSRFSQQLGSSALVGAAALDSHEFSGATYKGPLSIERGRAVLRDFHRTRIPHGEFVAAVHR